MKNCLCVVEVYVDGLDEESDVMSSSCSFH